MEKVVITATIKSNSVNYPHVCVGSDYFTVTTAALPAGTLTKKLF
jgi:hypothetical protein